MSRSIFAWISERLGCLASSTVLATSSLLVTGLLSQESYGGFAEPSSDLFCCCLLLLANEFFFWPEHQYRTLNRNSTATHHAWEPSLIAGGVGVATICRMLVDVRWVTPALTPILLAFRMHRTTGLPLFKEDPARTLSAFVRTLWIMATISVVSLWALSSTLDLKSAFASVSAYFAQLVVFVCLYRVVTDPTTESKASPDLPKAIRGITRQSSALLAIICVTLHYTYPGEAQIDLAATVKYGVLKATHWCLLFHECRGQVPWEISTSIATYSFASYKIPQPLFKDATVRALVSIAGLGQTIFLLPKFTSWRFVLLAFALVPILKLAPFGTDNWSIWNIKPSDCEPREHPIVVLSRRASEEFSTMLARQSQNITAAVDEYKRRYGRNPPPGFEQWFEYAKSVDSPIIDEFNVITESMEPFWAVSSAELRENIRSAQHDEGMVSFQLINGEFKSNSNHWMVPQISSIIRDVAHDIPDFEAVFNIYDEPRVIVPKHRMDEQTTQSPRGAVEWFDGSRIQDGYEYLTSECEGRGDTSDLSHTFEDFGLPFVRNITATKDVCLNPQYRDLHGFLQHPATLKVTKSAIPVLSQSRVSVFNDLLFPAPSYRHFFNNHRYNEDLDHRWEDKTPTLYWAGSTTGSHGNTADDWKASHRQRFVTQARHLRNSTQTYLIETEPGVWQAINSTEALSTLYDTRFTAIIQCEPEACEAEEEFFHKSDRATDIEAFRSRFLFDLDGNAHSGRYYVLLRSHSAVLKQTIFQEWHDERLIPWVHYIPVSLSMDELPETMRFLALTERGDNIARQIAEDGREWRMKALRPEDETVYLYRLFLEFARLLSDDREG